MKKIIAIAILIVSFSSCKKCFQCSYPPYTICKGDTGYDRINGDQFQSANTCVPK